MRADERIQIAMDNWAPRFVANGVDFNDLGRMADRITCWDDWCRVWSECAAMHAMLGEQAEAAEHYQSAAEHFLRSALTYHFGKFLFVHQPDEMLAAHNHVIDLYTRALPYFDPPAERVTIPYESGEALPGVFRKPWHVPRPPVVIMIPGLDSVKEELHRYGDEFLHRGLAVLAIDGPGQGEMEFRQPIRHDYEVPVRHVIDYLAGRGDIDAGRISVMGVSLGGYYAPRAAAFEPRIKAVIAIAGAFRFADHFEHLPVLTRQAFTARLRAKDEPAARVLLERFDLTGVMGRVTCPLLVIMGRKDRLVPPESAERMVREAGGTAELWMFDDGNHVCNNIPYKYRPQQADWMCRVLCA